ncbi:MAG TPA: hypothetical protein VGL53_27405, partial [Bryobacteraceae bacterium]
PLSFWYRESPVNLQGTILAFNRGIGLYDPQARIAGEITTQSDVHGHLTNLEAVPPQRDDSPPPKDPMNWDPLFQAAGLDSTKFTPTDPQWQPLAGWDSRTAWTGTMPEVPGTNIRVEAASWRNRPVYFDVIGPWTRPWRQQRIERTFDEKLQQIIGISVIIVTVIAAAFFVRANLRAGRVDRKGAFRLGAYAFSVTLAALLLFGHHQSGMGEFFFFIRAFSNACFLGVLVWLLYMAVEPPVRRRWPQTMISWSRALAGRFQDPIVASHVLAGLGAGSILVIISVLATYVNLHYGDSPSAGYLGTLLGIRQALGGIAQALVVAPAFAMASFFILFLFRLVLRRDWLTALLYILFLSAFAALGEGNVWIQVGSSILGNIIFTTVLLRYGLLANVVMMFTSYNGGQFPITLDLGSWRGGITMLVGVILIGCAIYSFRIALAHRKVFNDIDG